MIKVEFVETWGFYNALRGMRNPLDSWDRSDSGYTFKNSDNLEECFYYSVGKNDMELMRKLYKAGSEHRKFLRQVFVSMDITAPFYWY
jgi:hypothetical protein